MRRTVLIAALIAAPVVALGVVVLVSVRSQRPEALLSRLAKATTRGERDELVMRLNVVRGDVVRPMIAAVKDTSAPAGFRVDVMELLFKRNHRSRERRIEQAILAAVNDPAPEVRRMVLYGLAVYAEPELQVAIADLVADPDPQVRRQVYLTFGASVWHRLDPDDGVWRQMSPRQRQRMVQECLERMKTEGTPKLRLMARAIVGREIEVRAHEANRALQTSDIAKAEKLLKSALALDPTNHQGQIRLVRFYLKTGRKDEAVELARKHGALLEIPKLSKPPSIDGDPTDKVWSEAFTSETFWNDSRWVPQKIKGKSKVFVGHHRGTIYIAAIGYEADLTKLARRHTGRDDDLWTDDCFELLFDPAMTEKDVYQFVINPNGAVFDHLNMDKSKNFKCQFKAALFPDRGYWACEFALRGEDLDNHRIKSGIMWALNVFHTRVGTASEAGSMWPTFGHAHRVYLYPLSLFK